MAGYYLTLINEVDTDKFSDNTPYHFRNLIQPEIPVSSDTEVALAEISFTQAVEIDGKNEDKAEIFLFDFLYKKHKDPPMYGMWHTLPFSENEFGTPDQLCQVMNEKIWAKIPRLRDAKNRPFQYDKKMRRIWYNYLPDSFYLVLVNGFLLKLTGLTAQEKAMQYIALGKSKRSQFYRFEGKTRQFAPEYRERFRSSCEGRNYADLEPLMSTTEWPQFIVYSNIVGSSPIGSTLANYLRFIDLSEDDAGKVVTKTFENRFYFPISVSFINTVGIELRQMSGKYVCLKGCTRIVLHIRKKQ